MLDSYGLVLFLLWLVAGISIVLFARWLHRFLATSELSTDLQVLLLVAIVGVVLLGILNFLWKLGASQAISPPTSVTEATTKPTLDSFEQKNYPDLYALRQQLLQQLTLLDNFFQRIPAEAEQMPTQKRFLQKIVDIRWAQRQQLRKAYYEVDRSRREFWLHYQTVGNNYVLEKYHEEVKRLTRLIKEALGDSHKARQQETDTLHDYILDMGELLNNPTPPKQKRSKITNKAVPVFQPYAPQNAQQVIDGLKQLQAQGIIDNILKLQTDEQVMRGKIADMLAYRRANQDLAQEVHDLVILWNETLIANQYAQYRLLAPAETIEMLIRLKLAFDQRDIDWLYTQLQLQAPEIVQQAFAERQIVEYSYNPATEHQYRKRTPDP